MQTNYTGRFLFFKLSRSSFSFTPVRFGQPRLTEVAAQPLDYLLALTERRVKDAEGTAQPLVLDSVRWLGYLAAHIHNLPLTPPARTNFPSCPLLYRRFIVFYTYTQNER